MCDESDGDRLFMSVMAQDTLHVLPEMLSVKGPVKKGLSRVDKQMRRFADIRRLTKTGHAATHANPVDWRRTDSSSWQLHCFAVNRDAMEDNKLIDRRSRGALLPGKLLFFFGSMTSFSILTRSSNRSSFAVSSSGFTPAARDRRPTTGLHVVDQLLHHDPDSEQFLTSSSPAASDESDDRVSSRLNRDHLEVCVLRQLAPQGFVRSDVTSPDISAGALRGRSCLIWPLDWTCSYSPSPVSLLSC
ncbi:hypothetical protein INR49_003622 [Caranx melampygus]|nr:hypothetical protein INR49_003622 [Caranx melampygus]